MALTLRDYEKALWAQDASNLSGIVNSLAEVLPRIREEVNNDTSKVNQHPIVRLYAEQISHLSGAGVTSDTGEVSYHTAYEYVEKKIEELSGEVKRTKFW